MATQDITEAVWTIDHRIGALETEFLLQRQRDHYARRDLSRRITALEKKSDRKVHILVKAWEANWSKIGVCLLLLASGKPLTETILELLLRHH